MKVHTLMKYTEGVSMVVDLTSAAKHDHYLLKEIHLPKDSTLAIDRAYIDYAQYLDFLLFLSQRTQNKINFRQVTN